MPRLTALAALIGLGIAATSALAQTAVLVGTVMRDSLGHALTGAEVRLPSLGRGATVNYLGEFKFDRLPAGRHEIVIRRIGFVPLVDTIAVGDGAQIEREFVLTEQPTPLDSVRVTAPERKYISPGLREFEERRKVGIGYFIAEDEMRKNDDRNLLNVITGRIPGLRTYRPDPRNPGAYYISSGRKCGDGPALLSCRGNSACPVMLYLNGIVVFNPATEKDPFMVPDFSKYATNEYAAVEYYAGGGSMPAKYNMTGSGCGALLLWTRER
jgi:carboxypeptidase-like protein